MAWVQGLGCCFGGGGRVLGCAQAGTGWAFSARFRRRREGLGCRV